MPSDLLRCVAVCAAFFAAAITVQPAALAGQVPTSIIAEVALDSPQSLDNLVRAGVIIDSVRSDSAIVYLREQELADLTAAGFDIRIIGSQPGGAKVAAGYRGYAAVTAELQSQASAFPAICRLSTLGQSEQGREIWALLITDSPDIEEDEPEFKYVSTMHGDEPVGTENCMRLIDRILTDYGSDSRITQLVNTTAIWIVPLMNPDGLELDMRQNASGYDLNRTFPAFPDDFTGTFYDGEPLGDAGRPAEVRHIMNWTAANSFTLSANLHTGSLVVNYPYDDDGLPSGSDTPTPDDLLFEDISRRYSVHNLPMWNNPQFPDGITNGTAWYTMSGGMQDWHYRYIGCNEVTLELSNVKAPPASELDTLWADNEESMLSYMEAIHMGVRGVITDADTGNPLYASILVEGNAHPVFSDPDVGDYHRMLLPGTYTLTISVAGYPDERIENITVQDGITTRVDVTLTQDADGDGLSDAVEGTGDADGDGTPNYLDPDSDDDGIPDGVDGPGDFDDDGVQDFLDTDSDNDGVTDGDEGLGDPDGDGSPNFIDVDSDGDGYSDEVEAWLAGSDPYDAASVPSAALPAAHGLGLAATMLTLALLLTSHRGRVEL